jgi:hypothetical protein
MHTHSICIFKNVLKIFGDRQTVGRTEIVAQLRPGVRVIGSLSRHRLRRNRPELILVI